MFLKEETWSQAVDLKDKYEVSNRGNVRRLKKTKNGIIFVKISKKLRGGEYVFKVKEFSHYVYRNFEELKYGSKND